MVGAGAGAGEGGGQNGGRQRESRRSEQASERDRDRDRTRDTERKRERSSPSVHRGRRESKPGTSKPDVSTGHPVAGALEQSKAPTRALPDSAPPGTTIASSSVQRRTLGWRVIGRLRRAVLAPTGTTAAFGCTRALLVSSTTPASRYSDHMRVTTRAARTCVQLLVCDARPRPRRC
eukprot:873321-Rhodomonas_salina.1